MTNSAKATYREIRDRVLERREPIVAGDASKLRTTMCVLADDPSCFSLHDALALLAGWRDHPERYLHRLFSDSEMREIARGARRAAQVRHR